MQDDMETAGAVLTVPALLNVFYRGRRLIAVLTACGLLAGIAYGIIVRPLYRATAQVRPGVVSYRPDGTPEREWALEDVVNWFDGRLYWRDFRALPEFEQKKSPPVIDASFTPSLNFVAGGNVITLTNLARSRSLAERTLDASITAFNRQAMADSMGSTLHLTLRRGRAQVRKLNRDIEQVDAKADRVDLEIAQQQRELAIIDLRQQELELELKTREADNVWIDSAVATARNDAATARQRLTEAEKVLAIAVGQEARGAGSVAAPAGTGDPVAEILKQTATREQAGRVGDLVLTVNELTAFISQQTVQADSLTARMKVNDLEIKRLRLLQDVQLEKDRADVRQKINALRISLTKDLPYERNVLRSELESEQAKVDLVSPLERIGETSVSLKPVRPRKLRAAAILTILAFFGSLFLVLIREYVRNNREAITATGQPRQ